MNVTLASAGLCLALLLGGCASGTATLQDDHSKSAIAARTYTQIGVEYLRDNNFEQARKNLQKALDLEPDYALAHDAIAILYERVNDNDNAEKHYRTSLRLNPANSDARSNYGQFLCRAQRFDEAEKEFVAAAANPYYKNPQIPLFNAGVCMANKPDAVAAEKYYRQAIDKSPKFAPALLKMAELMFTGGDYLKTRAWLQRYQTVEKNTPETLWLGVRTEYALGDHQAWGNYALQLRNLYPDSEQAGLLREWEHERKSGN